MDEKKDIVDTAMGLGSFPTLVTALSQDPAWVAMLKESGPFTVFAPTEEAFKAALEGQGWTVEQLLADKAMLGKILTYHVVQGKAWMAADIMALTEEAKVMTVEGHEVTVKHDDAMVWVNGAQVVQADVACSNGVIHAINAVLMPPTEAATPSMPMGETTPTADDAAMPSGAPAAM